MSYYWVSTVLLACFVNSSHSEIVGSSRFETSDVVARLSRHRFAPVHPLPRDVTHLLPLDAISADVTSAVAVRVAPGELGGASADVSYAELFRFRWRF